MENLKDGVAARIKVNAVKSWIFSSPTQETRGRQTHASMRLDSMTLPFWIENEMPERKRMVVTATPIRVDEIRSGTAP